MDSRRWYPVYQNSNQFVVHANATLKPENRHKWNTALALEGNLCQKRTEALLRSVAWGLLVKMWSFIGEHCFLGSCKLNTGHRSKTSLTDSIFSVACLMSKPAHFSRAGLVHNGDSNLKICIKLRRWHLTLRWQIFKSAFVQTAKYSVAHSKEETERY